MSNAKMCLYEYMGSKKAKELIIDQYSDYFSEDNANNFFANLKDFIDTDKMTDVICEYAKHQGIGHWDSGPVELLVHNIDRNKLNEYINEKLSDSTVVFRKILMKYECENKNQKLYIVDQNNQVQYFCDTQSLPNVKIELKGRELVCEYIAVDKFKKYIWPSDTPLTVVTDITTVVFNVSDNSVKSFKHTSSTHEEQVKYRR